MPLYPVIVVGVLALVSLAALIGTAQEVDGGRAADQDAAERRCLTREWTELAEARRALAVERAVAAAECTGGCLPPRSWRCPRCGHPLPPFR